jgi:uncharacterized protein
MRERILCIYHSRDLDGWMSAAIVKEKFQLDNDELLGWDYNGQPLPEIPTNRKVIMVDICFPKDIMIEISEVNGLIWIDHHISAINDIGDIRNLWGGIQATNKAACELTWQYFFNDPMPEIVRLLGRYDCFGHKGTDEEQKVLEFQYAARSYWKSISDCHEALNQNDQRIVGLFSEIGKGIYKYLCTDAEQKYAKKFEIFLDDKLFACVNDWRLNPINFGINYHADGYDGFACFWYENGCFNYSLYNDNGEVDCSIIAKLRGGGGHKGASGFRSEFIIK